MAGDHSGKRLGEVVAPRRARVHRRRYSMPSGDRFEDLGVRAAAAHRRGARAAPLARSPRSASTSRRGRTTTTVARELERHFLGWPRSPRPGQAIKVDTLEPPDRADAAGSSLLLALIVGGIEVTNTMAMSVFERTREIGILRAVGWSVNRIGVMIVSEAVGLCLIALGVGCGVGVLAARVFVDRGGLSVLISPHYTASTFAWGLRLRARRRRLRCALPSTWRAVRLAPIEALRHE